MIDSLPSRRGTELSQRNLDHIPNGPSMLDDFQARSMSNGVEARFAAVQRNDDRACFQQESTLRIKKELASLEETLKSTNRKD